MTLRISTSDFETLLRSELYALYVFNLFIRLGKGKYSFPRIGMESSDTVHKGLKKSLSNYQQEIRLRDILVITHHQLICIQIIQQDIRIYNYNK